MKRLFLSILSMLVINYVVYADTQFNYCLESAPDKFDSSQTILGVSLIVGRQIFDALVAVDPRSGNAVPALAEYWEISPDGKKYIFHLRKGIQFQSNNIFKPTRDLQAEDVVFSITRQLDKNNKFYNKGNYVWADILNWNLIIKNVKAVDQYTVEIDLALARAPFLLEMAMPQAWIMSKEYADKLATQNQLDKLNEQPIGTSAYQLTKYDKNSIILDKFNKYWGKKSNIDEVVMPIIPNENTRTEKIISGECDFVTAVAPSDVDNLLTNKNIEMVKLNGMATGGLYLNTQDKYLSNADVRKAIAYAIDYNRIINETYSNKAVRINTNIPSNLFGHNDKIPLITRDLEKARNLMSTSPYPKGFNTSIWVLPISRPYMPNSKDTVKIIQSNLKDIGIHAKIVTYNWTDYVKNMVSGKGAIVTYGWIADIPDPDNFISPTITCQAISHNNVAMYCNNDLDLLAKKATETTDAKTRKLYYDKIQEIMAEDVPVIPLAQPIYYYAVNKRRVKDYVVSSFILMSQISLFNVKN